jgi:thiamine-phosphate pyrophosphorylase
LQHALGLYLVTDQSLTRGRPLADVVAAAVQGGVTCVQLREKQLNSRDFLAQAVLLKKLLAPYGVPLVINDRIDIALACGAEGVHLGQSDMPVEVARRLLPSDVFIGWSVETLADVAQSARLPLDYLGVSPVFATPTKTDTSNPWGLEGLRQVRAATALPLVAIGGINLDNAQQVLKAGADGLAVVSALCAAESPASSAAEFVQILKM